MEFIQKAIEAKALLDTFRPLKPEVERRVLDKFRLDWNYHSNNLEGNSLTFGETKALLLHNITAQGKPLKDHIEITGHNEAIDLMLAVVRGERPLTEHFIREIHTLLLKEPYKVDAITPDGLPTQKTVQPGVYKSSPNHVKTATGGIFKFAEPEETPAKMHDLIEWYRNKLEVNVNNPVVLAAEFHYRFIRIHPFDDGNGRTARILMNFILMQYGYPPVIIRTEDKQAYFSVLRQADAGSLQPFIEYVAQNLLHSLDIMMRAINGKSIEDPDDFDKEIALIEQKLRNLGEPAKIVKSTKVLHDLYQDSLFLLATELEKKTAMLDKFYARTSMTIWIDGLGFPGSSLDRERYKSYGTNITEATKDIKISKEFQAFNNPSFNEFGYTSTVLCTFLETRYNVQDEKGEIRFDKPYSDSLTRAEIDKLIRCLQNQHKNMIEAKMDELRQ